MKPEMPAPNFTPEKSSIQYGSNFEHIPNPVNPEFDGQEGAEHYEKNSEMHAIISDVGLTSVLPTPVVGIFKAVDNTTIDDNPAIAGDGDLIERDWVDKAKKIVNETKDDPYKCEQAVTKLQADYLNKRFKKGFGATK